MKNKLEDNNGSKTGRKEIIHQSNEFARHDDILYGFGKGEDLVKLWNGTIENDKIDWSNNTSSGTLDYDLDTDKHNEMGENEDKSEGTSEAADTRIESRARLINCSS